MRREDFKVRPTVKVGRLTPEIIEFHTFQRSRLQTDPLFSLTKFVTGTHIFYLLLGVDCVVFPFYIRVYVNNSLQLIAESLKGGWE